MEIIQQIPATVNELLNAALVLRPEFTNEEIRYIRFKVAQKIRVHHEGNDAYHYLTASQSLSKRCLTYYKSRRKGPEFLEFRARLNDLQKSITPIFDLQAENRGEIEETIEKIKHILRHFLKKFQPKPEKCNNEIE